MKPTSPGKLLSPMPLGGIELKNRIVFGAHRTNLAEQGLCTNALAEYYLARARGGCGAIIIGELSIHPNDRPYEKIMEVNGDLCLEGLAELARRLKDAGVRVLGQLMHRGFQSSGAVTRRECWGPVANADVAHGEVCKQMEAEDIDELVAAFESGAVRLMQAGFDGVEVSIGPHSLLRQFLSPMSNFRGDEYGGELEQRLRISLEVLQAVRRVGGDASPLGVEICLDERFWGGLTVDDAVSAAKLIAGRGLADYFSATVGTYYNLHLEHASMHHEPGLVLESAKSLKQAVGMPVMAGNRIMGPAMAEQALLDFGLDAVRWVRPLICDPAIPNKLTNAGAGQIRHCSYDNQDCMGRVARGKPIGCIQNPLAGKEAKPAAAGRPISKNQRVMIIGAGPAGLAAALELAENGIIPVIFDKAPEPGGQALLASSLPEREELGLVVSNLVGRLKKFQVPMRMGEEMNSERILSDAPDALIVATGSIPKVNPFTGEYGPPQVLDLFQLFSGEYKIGERVLLVDEDGHFKAAGTAQWLAGHGKQVQMVTSGLFIGLDLAAQGDLSQIRSNLLIAGVRFYSDLEITAIQGDRVMARNTFSGEKVVFQEHENVILAVPHRADYSLYSELKVRIPLVLRAGDCVAPRRIGQAVNEGHLAARTVVQYG